MQMVMEQQGIQMIEAQLRGAYFGYQLQESGSGTRFDDEVWVWFDDAEDWPAW